MGLIKKMNLQLFAEPPATPLTEEELIDQVADIPVVDSDEAGSVEDFLEGLEEGGAGEEPPATEKPAEGAPAVDDPYAFIKEQTPYTDQETIVEGYKNIQSHASKLQERADKLQAELDAMKSGKPAGEITDIEELQNQGLSAEDIKSIVSEQMKESLSEDRESRDIENETARLDSNYNEALSMEGWGENQAKVYGIIKQYPNIANNTTVSNPYKLALEMAKNPELMQVYNKYPELLESQGGGLRMAQDMCKETPARVKEVIKTETDKAKDEETKRQIELTNSAVGEPSSGDTGEGEKAVKDMTKEEVFEAVGHIEDME